MDSSIKIFIIIFIFMAVCALSQPLIKKLISKCQITRMQKARRLQEERWKRDIEEATKQKNLRDAQEEEEAKKKPVSAALKERRSIADSLISYARNSFPEHVKDSYYYQGSLPVGIIYKPSVGIPPEEKSLQVYENDEGLYKIFDSDWFNSKGNWDKTYGDLIYQSIEQVRATYSAIIKSQGLEIKQVCVGSEIMIDDDYGMNY